MEQQINDLLKQVFTLDGNGRVALRMLIAGGLSAKWKDPVNTVADLPNTDPEGVTRVVLDDNGAIKIYTVKNGSWEQHAGGASYIAGNGVNIASYVVSVDADTAKGLAFFSGKLGLNIDTNTLAFTAGVLGVKSGVYASVSHTHTASNISDWATSFATSFNSNFSGKTTDDLTEGSTKKYFANSLARASISVSSTGLSYDNVNGIISITSGYAIPTSSQITNWDSAYTQSHTHSNKTLLDTYTQTEANLADAVLNKHTHANKSILDATQEAFTSTLKTNYDTAYTNSHTHANKSVLDSIVVSSPVNGQVLKYDSASGHWINSTGGGGSADLDGIDAGVLVGLNYIFEATFTNDSLGNPLIVSETNIGTSNRKRRTNFTYDSNQNVSIQEIRIFQSDDTFVYGIRKVFTYNGNSVASANVTTLSS